MIRSVLIAVMLTGLAACSGSPEALGLTGATPQTPPEQPGDNAVIAPGVTQQGSFTYNPTITPSTGGGRYYGY